MSKPWTPTTEEVLDGLGYTWIDWHRLVASEEELEAAFWRWFDEERGAAWMIEVLVGIFLLLSLGFCLHAMWVLIFRPDEW